MPRPQTTLTPVLVFLAIAVSVATAVAILTLPSVGTVRYGSTDSRSSLAQLRDSLAAVGIVQPTGTIQSLVRRDTHPLGFRTPTYWTSADVDTRRTDYLAAGGVVALTLILSAFVFEKRAE